MKNLIEDDAKSAAHCFFIVSKAYSDALRDYLISLGNTYQQAEDQVGIIKFTIATENFISNVAYKLWLKYYLS